MEGARVKSSLPGLAQLLACDKREPFCLPGIQIFGASKMQYDPVSVLLMVQKSGGNAPFEVGS